MRHQLEHSSMRFLRVSSGAWAIAILGLVIEQVAVQAFHVNNPFSGAFILSSQALFGFGCVAAFGTASLRFLSRSSIY